MRDLYSHVAVLTAIAAASVADNTPAVSAIIDTRGYDSLTFVLGIGAVGDADATFAVLVEDGDQANLADAAAVDDSELLGTEAAAGFRFDDDNETRKIGYIGHKRYVRLTITPTGNASAALISVLALLGHPNFQGAA
ncbi:MAG: hypothetical protein INF91_04880 [Alphaproteobacteria bacterium]|nr:hypothetical protein [Alphaproteobacteria bacterium]